MINECNAKVIAMALDCEGCIGITRIGGHRVTVGNTELKLLTYLQELSDNIGRITGPYENGYKPFWVWNIPAKNLVSFLAAIAPHLVIKRKQAELLLRIRKAITNREPIDRHECWREMRELNGNSNIGRRSKGYGDVSSDPDEASGLDFI